MQAATNSKKNGFSILLQKVTCEKRIWLKIFVTFEIQAKKNLQSENLILCRNNKMHIFQLSVFCERNYTSEFASQQEMSSKIGFHAKLPRFCS